jgi:diguanylate cyclase (GGDEF)-like protein
MQKPGWLNSGSLLIGLCALTTLGACVPAAIIAVQLFSLRSGIEDINRATMVASRARHVQEIIGHSLVSFVAVAVDLSPDERARVHGEADRQFDILGSSVAALVSSADGFISDSLRQALVGEIADVKHGWADIRDEPYESAASAERSFHFLRLVKEVRDARAILSAIETHAGFAATKATRASFDHVRRANLLLIGVIAAAAIIVGMMAFAGVRIARSMRRTNIELQRKNLEIASRDREITGQNERFTVALDNMSQGLCMFGTDKRLVVCNTRYLEMYGLPESLGQAGTHFRDILEHRVAQGVYGGDDPEAYVQERLDAVAEGVASTKIHQLTTGRTIAIVHQPMADGGWVATHEDITELQRVEARMAHMALHDALTDLPNRVLLRERIVDALQRGRRGERFAVLCLDLDRFKSVNDTLGHPVGDSLLTKVADRLRACVRETDTVGRLGGDEFAITQVSGPQPESAIALAARICETIAEPFDLNGNQVVVGASIGIAIGPTDGTDPDQLLKNADMALYRAKGDGRGVYRFFETEMDARMQARRQLELDMRKTMEDGGFRLHYQPLTSLDTGEITGFEALMRWPHPDRGMIPPDEFISIAEETGMIIPLGEWALRTACMDAAAWPHRTRIAVNLSPVQFRSDRLVETVFSALAHSGLAANRLELEITESVLLQDNDKTMQMLHRFRDMGVRIAMDDFGTGYSSLSYLRSFPFDKIKIDRSFVNDIGAKKDAAAIVDVVASLSRTMGMTTTAEGVETQEQLEKVKAAGYTEMQGFLFSRAMSAEDITGTYFSHKARKKAAT